MQKVGATKLYDPDRLAIVLDHISPAKTEKNATDQQICRNFARNNGVNKFYDVDAGIAHLVLMEAGHVAPGDLIVGTDSHCTIYGSLGALGTGIGYTEVASVWITGKLWMKVPETFRITSPELAPGVYSKDLMLHLIGRLGADGCGYKSVEFYGDATGPKRFRAHDHDQPGHGNGREVRVRAAGCEDRGISARAPDASKRYHPVLPMRTPCMKKNCPSIWPSWNRWSLARTKFKTPSRFKRSRELASTRRSWDRAPTPSTKIWKWRRAF